MKTPLNNLFALLCLVLFDATQSGAQTYDWSADVGKVQQDGFYSLSLSPSISSKLRSGMEDLRVYDTSGTEIPYLIKRDQFTFDKRYFSDYVIESKQMEKGCCTKLIISNPKSEQWDNFCLLVKNHEVNKTATLSGSDDKENWFALREGVVFSPLNNSDETFGACYVSFPLSNYRYFSLEINDSTTAPLNILHVGNYSSEQTSGKFEVVPLPVVSQVDSNKLKRTYVQLLYDAPYVIQKMELTFGGPKFFSREALLYEVEYDTQKNRQLTFIQSFQISSRTSSMLVFDGAKHIEYLIEVHNGDSPPVRLKSVTAYQLNTFLLAYLEANKAYRLKMGNKEVSAPAYDLSGFADSIPADLPLLQLSNWKREIKPMKAQSPKESLFKTKAWIWAAIVLVVGFLGWMSVRMLKEMSREN